MNITRRALLRIPAQPVEDDMHNVGSWLRRNASRGTAPWLHGADTHPDSTMAAAGVGLKNAIATTRRHAHEQQ